jgi:NADH:ubiquinone reductase (H+-translocating)
MSQPHKIVIVGAGAGGLELAARLSRKVKKYRDEINVNLVNPVLTHIWKPLLHEVAAGTLSAYEDEINLLAYASEHGFSFHLGSMEGLDRKNRSISLAPLYDENHEEIVPTRHLNYTTLVMAVGSIGNDFGIPGAKEHCIFLDTLVQAKYFHQQYLNNWLALYSQQQLQKQHIAHQLLDIVIIGGGATGVELAAELRAMTVQMMRYDVAANREPTYVNISVIEAASRLVATLSEKLSQRITDDLKKLNIHIYLSQSVQAVTADGIMTDSGTYIPSALTVWAAGIKAPIFLKNLDGLETNKHNQLIVKTTLQTTEDVNIFAMGDCASCLQPGHAEPVPARAQAANQQAAFLARALICHLKGQKLPIFYYRDYGSLVALSNSAVGQLRDKTFGNIFVEGTLARLAYRFLHIRHLIALYGYRRTIVWTIAQLIGRTVRPRLKLH